MKKLYFAIITAALFFSCHAGGGNGRNSDSVAHRTPTNDTGGAGGVDTATTPHVGANGQPIEGDTSRFDNGQNTGITKDTTAKTKHKKSY